MPSTLNLEDSNALLAVPEWGKLLRHFELGEGFALVVLLVPDTAVSRMCQTELDLWLQARQRPRLTPVPVENSESLEQLPEQLLSMAPPSGPVWISGVGTRDRYESAWQRCAVKLNRTRDAIVSRYSATLILVGPPWVREILRDNAPDFWSIRAFVADISLPRRTLLDTPENPPTVQTTVDESPDPDFALAQAAKLRYRPGLHRELSWLLDRAGKGLMQRGRFKEAEQVLREALQIDEMITRQEPERADYLRDLSVSYNKMGNLMRSLGASDEARQFFQKSLNIDERLVRQEPERADYLRDLSVSYNKMGDLMYSLGASDEARQFYQKALDIAERLVRQEPERADYLRDLSVSYNKMGNLMHSLGASDEARQFFQKSLNIDERLVRQEPERADYLRDLSVSYDRLGDLMHSLGASDEARQFFQKSLDIRERLVRQEPERADYLSDLALSLHRIGTPDTLRRAIDILGRMESEHKLTRAQADWMPLFEQALAVAEQD